MNPSLNDLVKRRGQVRIAPMTGASRLEWTEALSLLATSAVLVSQWLTDRGRAEWNIHFRQETHVTQSTRIGRVDGESRVSVSTPVEFTVPTEIADRLDPATIDRLLASLTAHMEAAHKQRSTPGEHQ
jgi:hypothetical protein